MKIFFAVIISILLAACGSNVQHRETGLEHQQQLVVIADNLIGHTISVAKINNHTISSADLTPYATGVAGAADAKDENRQILMIKVDKGTHNLVIKNPQGQTVYSKSVYLADGQNRTIRL